MRLDYKTVYQKNATFYQRHPIAKKILFAANHVCTATFFIAYSTLLVLAFIMPFSPKDIIKILAIPAVCLLSVMIVRIFFKRPRPYSKAGANITPLLHKKSGDNTSFPSRHLACAFVIAAIVFFYLPWAGICLSLIGLLLGYIRFSLGVHYPTDLLGGAALGCLCGLLLLI